MQSLVPEGTEAEPFSVAVAGKEIKGLKKFYAEAAPGSPPPSSTAPDISKYSCSSRMPARPFP